MQQHFGTALLITIVLGALSGLGLTKYLALDEWIIAVGMTSTFVSLILLKLYSLPIAIEPLLRVCGYVVGVIGLYAFFSPTLGGTRETYISLTSIIILIEASILLLLHGNAGRQVYGLGSIPISLYKDVLNKRSHSSIASE